MRHVAALLALVGLSVAGLAPATAQTFRVVASSPASGAAGVPLSTTIRFTFDQEVDVATDWNEAFTVEPRDSVRFVRTSLLLDDRGRPAVVTYQVRHTPGTDFTWMVYAVETAGGQPMTEPHVLRYTTAPTAGARVVEGQVTTAAAKQGPGGARYREAVRGIVAAVEARQADRAVAAPLPPGVTARVAGARRAGGPVTLVYLLGAFTTSGADWDVRAATVAGPSGYRIEGVRAGTYWPLAVRYTDASATAIDAVGFADADADGAPDSVVVGASDRTGIHLPLVAYPLSTARAYLDAARAEADRVAPGQALRMILAGDGARPAGTAYRWTYRFHAPGMGRHTSVVVDPLGATVDTAAAPAYLPGMAPLDGAFVDTDAALGVVMAGGGSAFLAGTPARNVQTVIEGGNLHWALPPGAPDAVWRVRLTVATSTGSKSLTTLVDMATGAIRTDADAAPDLPAAFRLDPNYPNPFNPSTVVPFVLDAAGPVRLSVYDLTGRCVAVLLDGTVLPAGAHGVRWEAGDLAGGVYFCRLEAGGRTATRALTLAR